MSRRFDNISPGCEGFQNPRGESIPGACGIYLLNFEAGIAKLLRFRDDLSTACSVCDNRPFQTPAACCLAFGKRVFKQPCRR